MDCDMKAEVFGGARAWARRRGGWCAARTLAWTGPGAYYYWGVLGRRRAQAGAVLCTGPGWVRLVKECLARRGGAEESRG
jgi:hypothetical protein